jgi:hypothetical protein
MESSSVRGGADNTVGNRKITVGNERVGRNVSEKWLHEREQLDKGLK